jgi:hypothetical protein
MPDQPVFPATPAGTRLAEAISILNNGDLGSMTEYTVRLSQRHRYPG